MKRAAWAIVRHNSGSLITSTLKAESALASSPLNIMTCRVPGQAQGDGDEHRRQPTVIASKRFAQNL
jgi:hypothetical protein